MHALPKDFKLREKWLFAIGRIDLLPKNPTNYRVCDKHFSEDQKFNFNQNRTNLKEGSLPNLFIPMQKSDNYFCPPAVSIENLTLNDEEPLPSSSCVNKNSNAAGNKRTLLRELGVYKTNQLSPKLAKLYRMIAKQKKTIKRLNNCNKQRIQAAIDTQNSPQFSKFHLNKTTEKFITSQCYQQKRNPRGRRFTLDDKLFALTLFKQGPKSYRFLQKTFALPSRRTLQNLLKKTKITNGLCKPIIESLKAAVKKMSASEKYCTIMYDEMSLDCGVYYDPQNDNILGFENAGEGAKLAFADHAMVFMARGIRRRWKQPIAFYFCEHGMSAPNIVRNLKMCIRELTGLGFTVVATVSDQNTANVRANKLLLEETIRNFALKNKEYQGFGYFVDDMEVVPLYDAPHLQKGLRNNLFENDVVFTINKEKKRASWADVINLYEYDVGDDDTKMLNKLTDAHIYPHKIHKMKVKNAAQVFSHRVSSTMRKFGQLEKKPIK